MDQIAIMDRAAPLHLRMGSRLRLGDAELFELCARNPELRIERTAEGDLIVMTPAGWESSHRTLRVATALELWAERDGRGVASDASGGFVLPNGAMRAPDAAWVLRSRVAALDPEERKRFLPLCPDFVVELRSPSDDLDALRAKMEEWRANGSRLGWLIDPDERRVEVYRPGHPVERLEAPSELAGDPELEGFVLDLEPVWAPI